MNFRYKALCFSEGILYASRGTSIYCSRDYGSTFSFIAKINVGVVESAMAVTSLSRRVSRTGVHLLRVNSRGDIIAITKKRIHVKLRDNLAFELVFGIPRGSRPLDICLGKNEELVWGEYFGNDTRESVNIYRSYWPYTQWEICYTFDAKSIRHVHSVEYDSYRDGYWILTGDYDGEAALWFTEDGFGTVRLVLGGSQKYRAVVLYPEKDRVVGATDTQLEQNYIYSLIGVGSNYSQELHHEIAGPCFDLVKCSGIYICSSVIEKSEVNTGNHVCIYASLDGVKWKQIMSFEKDIFPKKMHLLTQFSTVSLISTNESPYLYMYGRGVKAINQKTRRIHYKELLELLNEN